MTATASSVPIPRQVFTMIMYATLIIGFLVIRKAYANPTAAALVLLMLSFIMVNVWTNLFQHRWALNPNEQYPSFWHGDLYLLPILTAVPLALLITHLPKREEPFWFESWWWAVIAILVALGISLFFGQSQKAAFPMEALDSADKMWHDRVVYPLFAYFLVSAVPAIWYSEWGFQRLFHNPTPIVVVALIPFLGVGLWLYAGLVVDRKYDDRVDASRAYDWITGEVSDRLILTKRNGVIKWELPRTWHTANH